MRAEDILTDYELRKLTLNDKVDEFDCGDEDLNDFINNDEPLYRKALLAMTYILVNKNTHKTVELSRHQDMPPRNRPFSSGEGDRYFSTRFHWNVVYNRQ